MYRIGLGSLIGRLVLLLTTTGRKSGLPRVTPLGYDEIQNAFYIGSGIRGAESDWFKNAKANPRVHIKVGSRQFDGIAEAVTDPSRIADFIQSQLRRYPWMVGAILAADGLSRDPTRERLEAYAAKLAMLIVRPIERTGKGAGGKGAGKENSGCRSALS
jgi:deazaflavin-dependent oxidoreductase (nitroreductase family)